MADDREDLFGDLEDFDAFGGLDETPSGLDFPEEEDPFHMEPPHEEGISRAFKIVGALIGLAVVGLVVLLVWFALDSGDELTPNEKTSTAISGTNVASEQQYYATLTALAQIEQATQTQVRVDEMTGTAIFLDQQTQQAVRATSQAETATAEAIASQTAAAELDATQQALDAGATATADANRVRVRILDPQGNVIGTATLKLYRDDGDEVFTPADRLNPAGGETGTGGETSGGETGTVTGEAQPIDYGEIGEGELARGEVAEWTFTGTQGDSVIINAIAGDPVQMDMFMELYGPDGSLLVGDDDSGDASNAAITGFTLPQDGRYSIRVSSVASPGTYTLLLSLGLSIPAAPAEEPAIEEVEPEATAEMPAEPTQEGSTGWHVAPPGGEGIVLAGYAPDGAPAVAYRQGTPTPTADDLIEIIEEATEGIFDFGSLEPGIYWVELDYATLPPELQALVPPGQPLVFKLIVPVGGEFTIDLGAQQPTPTPETTPIGGVSDFDLTATAFAQRTGSPVPTIDTDIVTLTPTSEFEGTLPAPQGTIVGTGIFSDIGDDGDISGTSGLTVLAIAAAGLIAVVFIARKLRTSA